MNWQVRVTWGTSRTILQYLIVHAGLFRRVYSFCINVYNRSYISSSTNQIYDNQRQPNNHAIHSCDKYKTFSITFMCYTMAMHWIESYCIIWQNSVKYASPSAKWISRYLRWNSITSKRVSCVRTKYNKDYIFIWCCFLLKFF